jgi:phthalate 4,5-dioxygenase
MVGALESSDLTRIGPGTVMGELMRRYWLPAALSSEVAIDRPPLRLMLLGEQLIAFRDSAGRVGVMDHRCPHRRASLFLGRNEEGGIRCVYHGWKFDVEGKCVDMPSVPPHQDFKLKVRARAYKATERAGLIWVYMGDQNEIPELPGLEATLLPEGNAKINILQRECNWLQGLEGDIDTSHLGFLHAGSVRPDELGEEHPMYHAVVNRAPEYKVANTDWGTMYGAYRREKHGDMSWRIAHFLFPFWTMTPNSDISRRVVANAWVPMDDTHTMMIKIRGGAGEGDNFAYMPMKNGKPMPGAKRQQYLPNSTAWFGRWRSVNNPRNDWGVDREAQRNNILYSGISSIAGQDQAITESMGPITDHSGEHLGPGDQMIVRTRRVMLEAARNLRDAGVPPPGVRDSSVYWHARSGSFTAPQGQDWIAAYNEKMKVAFRWPHPDQRAAE